MRYLLLVVLLLTSCLRNTASLETVERLTLLSNEEFEKDSLPNDALTINSITLDGDGYLTFDVSHSGGCQEHVYGLYWESVLAKTDPPTIEFYLSHEANGDACEAWLNKTITVDISSVLGWAMNTSGEFTFRLAFHYPPDWQQYETVLFWTAPD